MMISSRPLPVGQVYTPKGGKRTQYREVVADHRGTSGQPFYVLRQVTRHEYCEWWEHETGTPVSSRELSNDVRRQSFYYEISMD